MALVFVSVKCCAFCGSAVPLEVKCGCAYADVKPVNAEKYCREYVCDVMGNVRIMVRFIVRLRVGVSVPYQ